MPNSIWLLLDDNDDGDDDDDESFCDKILIPKKKEKKFAIYNHINNRWIIVGRSVSQQNNSIEREWIMRFNVCVCVWNILLFPIENYIFFFVILCCLSINNNNNIIVNTHTHTFITRVFIFIPIHWKTSSLSWSSSSLWTLFSYTINN